MRRDREPDGEPDAYSENAMSLWQPPNRPALPLARVERVTDQTTQGDLSTTAGKIADLRARYHEAVVDAETVARDKQHAKGKLTARERIELLVDPGTFVELDEYVRHRTTAFGMDRSRPYGDAVVTGVGTIHGRTVAVYAQDFTTFGGSLGEVAGEKIIKVMEFALRGGMPIIGILDSGGARIQEGVVALGKYGEIFRLNTAASGVIPQISIIMGPAAGGAVYSPALTDFVIMVDKTSQMFVTGPDVIKTVTGEDVGMEELGGAYTHNTRSGVAHYLAEDEDDALDYARTMIGFLPDNNMSDVPIYENASQKRTKRAAFSPASMLSVPAMAFGWLAMTPTVSSTPSSPTPPTSRTTSTR